MTHVPSGPRTVALVGPYGSGKSTLFEALLATAGSPLRRGAERGGNELRMAHCTFMDEPWALIDCPGSVEFALRRASRRIAVADLAVVVCEPDPGARAHRRAAAADAGYRTACRSSCSSTASTCWPGRRATRWRRCSPTPRARWCCGRCRSARAARSSAMSTWSASAPTATAAAPPPTGSALPGRR